MKSIRKLLTATLLTAAAALTAATGMSIARAADDAAASPSGPFGMHQRGGPWHLLSKLGLSDAQKQQIKDIMSAAKPQMQSLHEQIRANALKLRQTQPTDANYASIASQASQTHGSLTAQMMTQRADVRAQVFKVLNPAQQTQLATLEAQMQTDRQGHRHGAEPSAVPPPAE